MMKTPNQQNQKNEQLILPDGIDVIMHFTSDNSSDEETNEEEAT